MKKVVRLFLAVLFICVLVGPSPSWAASTEATEKSAAAEPAKKVPKKTNVPRKKKHPLRRGLKALSKLARKG